MFSFRVGDIFVTVVGFGGRIKISYYWLGVEIVISNVLVISVSRNSRNLHLGELSYFILA